MLSLEYFQVRFGDITIVPIPGEAPRERSRDASRKGERATNVTKAAPKEHGEFTKRVIVASLLPDAEERHGNFVSSTATTMSNGAKHVTNS